MLITPNVKTQPINYELEDLKEDVHKYSGLNPDAYESFINNIELMEKHIQAGNVELSEYYLHNAIESVEELALYLTGSATESMEQILTIARKIGIESEKLIMNVALYKKIQFRPRYLNDLNI